MGFRTPVYIGERNAFEDPEDWRDTFTWFDRQGWSFTSWTYKANKYFYKDGAWKGRCNWGLFESDLKPVALDTASYEELAAVYSATFTRDEDRTMVYDMWKEYLGG